MQINENIEKNTFLLRSFIDFKMVAFTQLLMLITNLFIQIVNWISLSFQSWKYSENYLEASSLQLN